MTTVTYRQSLFINAQKRNNSWIVNWKEAEDDSHDGFVTGPNGEMDWIHVGEEIFEHLALKIGI